MGGTQLVLGMKACKVVPAMGNPILGASPPWSGCMSLVTKGRTSPSPYSAQAPTKKAFVPPNGNEQLRAPHLGRGPGAILKARGGFPSLSSSCIVGGFWNRIFKLGVERH